MFYSYVRIIFTLSLMVFSSAIADPGKKPVVIGISQITSHPSLDKVHAGIIEALNEAGYIHGSTAKIISENANGRLPVAVQIAQKLASENPDVAVGITTPCAQTLLTAFSQVQTPIVFATITDPIAAKLVPNLSHPGGRVTGTQNVFPLPGLLACLDNLFPQVKRVGVIVNLSEDNSATMVEKLKTALTNKGISLSVAPIANATEAKAAAESLTYKIDLLLLLQDNTVATTLPAVTAVMNQNQILTVATFVEAIGQGALMALAVDEKRIGIETGKIIVQILKGTPAGDIAVVAPNVLDVALDGQLVKTFQLEKNFVLKAKKLYPQLIIQK